MEPKLTEEDVNDIVSSCLYFIEVRRTAAGSRSKKLVPDLPRVMLDRQQIKQVFLNLFLNALDAMSERASAARSDETAVKPGGKPWVQIEPRTQGRAFRSESRAYF
jgi:C4-dicarboxylate-specific signal transduction histidine kinase